MLLLLAAAYAYTVDPSVPTPVLETSAFYDPVTETILVTGVVTGVAPADINRYRVILLGQTISLTSAPPDVVFQADIALSPSPIQSWHPYPAAYADRYWMDKPFLAELTSSNLRRVFARSHTWVSDQRQDGEVTYTDADVAITATMAAQLTETGLDANEDAWRAAVAWPDQAAYDADLSELLLAEPEQDTTFEVCRPITEVPDFRDTDGYTTAQVAATIASGVWVAAVAAGVPGANQLCVTELPDPFTLEVDRDEWEVCVGGARGSFAEGYVDGVTDVDLSYGGNGILSAQDFGLTTGVVDVTLTDLFVRWTGGGAFCGNAFNPRPQGRVDLSAGPSALEGWDECPGLLAGADDAATASTADMQTSIAASDPSLLDVTSVTPPSFSLGTTWVDVGTATCADSFVSAEIALFLEEFHYPLQFALGGAWEPDPPVSPVSLGTHGGAAAVDALLESWEMQSTCDALCGGHVLTAEFVDLSYPFGLAATYSTEDDPIVDDESWDVQSHLPGDLPFSDDGLDPNGDPFDFLAALSTSALSQVLTARADTDLAFNPADEWSDLGLDPVSFGLAPNAALVLNGTSMGAWSPTFSGLGRHAVEMALVPSIAPWAWMPPDPPDYVPGEYPVSVSLPQMQLTLTERRGGNVVTWLTAAVDFHDSDLQVGFGDGPFASITLGSPTVYVTVTQSRLTSTCPMVAHGNTALNVSTACERQMEVALADLIQPQLEARIEAILAEVPIPLPFWPASVETTVNTSFVWQEDQFVSYYAVFN